MNTIVLQRKLIYVGAIVLLLIPLYFLGHPSVRDSEGEPTKEGGTLAQIRTRDDLGQSDLGALEPASESARLATLGLRGVAATILWQKAEFYKREKYFDRMKATIDQLKILQPHFVKVWDYQAHNIAYNTSVEFDNYKHRYDWVKKGVYYLIEGCKFNKSRTELPFQLGDFTGSKMGIADEKVQYRELFRNDSNFHQDINKLSKMDLTVQAGRGPDGKPDNWRAGALWYQRAYDMVTQGSRPAKSPLMFYCKVPQWHMKYSEAIQSEGKLGEEARNGWNVAEAHLAEFGKRQIRTSFGTLVRLSELEREGERYAEKEKEFQEVCGEAFTNALNKLKEGLTDLQRQALEKDHADLSFDELVAAEQAQAILKVDPLSVARRVPSEKQLKALELAQQMKAQAELREHTERYRAQVNYTYWESRCRAEQDDAALEARTSMYQANKVLDVGKLDEAIELYNKAWVAWNALFNRHPDMMVDEAAEEVEKSVASYLGKIEKSLDDLPENFALKNFLQFRKFYKDDAADPAMMSLISKWPQRYPDRNFLEEVLNKSLAYGDKLKEFRAKQIAEEEPPVPNKAGIAIDRAMKGSVSDAIVGEGKNTPSVEQPKPAEQQKPAEPMPEAKPEQPKGTEPAPDQPKPNQPTADAPKPDPTNEPKADAPKPEEPKPEEPKPDAPKPEEPKPESPKPEPTPEPKPEEPKPTEPAPEQPKPEEPKPEEPKPSEPTPETPKPSCS